MENRILHVASAIALVALVAACVVAEPTPTASNEPALAAAEPSAAAASPSPPAGRQAQRIVVRPGQSVSRVAAEYGVSKRAIIEANQLVEPYKIKTGQRLLIPGSGAATPGPVVRKDREIVVEEGRSVGGIAAEYRVPTSAIIEANRLKPPYKIKTGQKLLIPNAAELPPTEVAVAAPPPAIAPAETPAPADSMALQPPAERAVGPPTPLPIAAAEQPARRAPEQSIAAASPEPGKAVATAPGAQGPVSAEPAPAPAAPPPMAASDQPALPVAATGAPPPVEATAAPRQPTPAAAPPGVTCPPGTTGMMSEDVIKQPVFICRRIRAQG